MASAPIQFSQRHALGEKKSWQGKDKQSSRNEVMDVWEGGERVTVKFSRDPNKRQRSLDDRNRRINTQIAVLESPILSRLFIRAH